jgi:hypothetical protein
MHSNACITHPILVSAYNGSIDCLVLLVLHGQDLPMFDCATLTCRANSSFFKSLITDITRPKPSIASDILIASRESEINGENCDSSKDNDAINGNTNDNAFENRKEETGINTAVNDSSVSSELIKEEQSDSLKVQVSLTYRDLLRLASKLASLSNHEDIVEYLRVKIDMA